MSFDPRLRAALENRGFSSVRDFIAARPRGTYRELADELSPPLVLPVMVMMGQLQEAKAAGRDAYRAALADSLVRALREGLPQGWSHTPSDQEGVSPGFVNIAVWSAWGATVKAVEPGDEVLDRLWDEIQKRATPGWLPATSDDPIIAAAFAAAQERSSR